MVVALVAAIILVATLAYIFQPVDGRGSVSSMEILVGTSAQFDFDPTQGIGPYKYLWSFGDGDTSSEKNPTHTYDRTGTYAATVTVTNWVGRKCTWSTIITVRLALVFIDSVSYPSWVVYYPLGTTYVELFVDGAWKTTSPVPIAPAVDHSIRLRIIGVADFTAMGGERYETTLLDVSGTVTAPATTVADIHCVLVYSPWDDPIFSLQSK